MRTELLTVFVGAGLGALLFLMAPLGAQVDPVLKLPLAEVTIDQADYNNLVKAIEGASNETEYLNELKRAFPQLKILTLPGPSGQKLSWQDSLVSEVEQRFYQQQNLKFHKQKGEVFVGAFEAYEEYNWLERPLVNFDLLLLSGEVKADTITHGVTHYLIHRARRAKLSEKYWPRNMGYMTYQVKRLNELRTQYEGAKTWSNYLRYVNQYLSRQQMAGGAAEEIGLAIFLYENKKDLQLTSYAVTQYLVKFRYYFTLLVEFIDRQKTLAKAEYFATLSN